MIRDKTNGAPRQAEAQAPFNESDASPDQQGATPVDQLQQPFSRGLFSFLLQFAAVQRWLLLSAALYFALTLLSYAVANMSRPGWGLIFGMLPALFLLTFGVVAMSFASVCWLAIVQDTANGYDKIQNWPDANFMDWAMDAFYVINSLVLSLLPGGTIGQLLNLIGGPIIGMPVWIIGVLAGLTKFWLFPVFLLSMLMSGSAFSPLSRTIWESFGTLKATWKTFYWLSAGLVLVVLLAYVLMVLVNTLPVRLFCVATTALMTMVYFRLLGRLAWVIFEKSPT